MKTTILLLIILSLILMQNLTFADIIYLKTGAKIEGVVENETEDSVTIVIKIGSMTYPREQIESISKSSFEENAKLKEKWKEEKERQKAEEEQRKAALEQQKKIVAEQEAKKLIFHNGQWITQEEYEKLTKPKVEEKKKEVVEQKAKPEKPKEKPKEEPIKPVDTVSFYDEVYRYRYRYAVRLPKNYDPKKKYPVLFMFDPAANGEDAARRFAYAANALGWIVVGSLDSKNGPWAPIERAQEAMLRDVPKRFSVDEKRFYAGGLSGGARAAFAFAYRHPTQFKGVIACAAGLSGSAKKSGVEKNVAVYFCVGKTDMNYEEVKEDYGKIRLTGAEVYVHEFDGGHEWPPQGVIEDALDWMASKTK